MDIDLNEAQKMLQRTARDFFEAKYPMSMARKMVDDEKGCLPGVWREIADLGWLGLIVPEEYGGEGCSFLDLLILLEETGRVCFLGPLFSTVVLGELLILCAGSEEQKKSVLPRMCSGELLATMALTEGVSFKPEGITLEAVANKDNFILSGTKIFVPDAHWADLLICVARTKKSQNTEDGITIFLVDSKRRGFERNPLKTIDGSKQSEVIFRNVKVPQENILGPLDGDWPIVEKILQFAAVAKCAESLGSAERVLEMTVQYAKERQQFGRPIGAFQVIQHFCVDMLTDVDTMRLATYQAGWMLSQDITCRKEVSMAKAWVAEAFKRVALYGLKIHGGAGYMEDHDMSLYFRRAQTAASSFGNADFHREMVAQELAISA
jgi:alkylation response protein AidB-like acyl-CoA dehydrogenase